jgi:hypothetical protein
MKRTSKFNLQQVFNKVWSHFVVEGRPYSVTRDTAFMPDPAIKGDHSTVDPVGLFYDKVKDRSATASDVWPKMRKMFDDTVTADHFRMLQNAHDHAVADSFDSVKSWPHVQSLFSRRYRRAFRTDMKNRLIAFAVNESLIIPSFMPRTISAKKAAKRFKD